MAKKVHRIPSLPQLPKDVLAGGPSAGGGTSSQYDPRDNYQVQLSRALFDWKLVIDELTDNTNNNGGHIIQDEGVDLPQEGRLNFIGATITAADDPTNGRTNVTVTGGAGGALWLFGNGADGAVDFDGTNTYTGFSSKVGSHYALIRPVFATDCIIRSGVTVSDFSGFGASPGGGQQIYCTGTFTNEGLCGAYRVPNTTNKYVAGLGTFPGVNGIYVFGSNGGDGGRVAGPLTGSAGTNITGYGGVGGAGGASSTPNAGGAAGTVTTIAEQDSGGVNMLSMPLTMQGGRVASATSPFWQRFGGGSGGGGGGAVTGTVEGGAGGGGGGPFLVCARFIATASGHLSCDGSVGNTGSGGSGNGGGGGGGGGGGVNLIITTTTNPTSLLNCTADGGAGGAIVGGIGTAGSPGSAGRVIVVVVT